MKPDNFYHFELSDSCLQFQCCAHNISAVCKFKLQLHYYVHFWTNTLGKGWFVCWVLWHINLCRLFNAKSVFM